MFMSHFHYNNGCKMCTSLTLHSSNLLNGCYVNRDLKPIRRQTRKVTIEKHYIVNLKLKENTQGIVIGCNKSYD